MAEPVIRVPFEEAQKKLEDVLLATGLRPEDARLCARLFAEASRDGVPSHGLNRFAGFVRSLRDGGADGHVEPQCVAATGALEQWDGRLGPGPLIAGNHIHDNRGGPGGIYLDEGSGFIEITGNAVYKVPTPMNYNNRAQDRAKTCREHDNFFNIQPPPAEVVGQAGARSTRQAVPGE